MIKVSVIIPVYNAEQYIDRSMKSLLQQTLAEIEFIFIDDCSQDNSLKKLESYKKLYPNIIKVISFPKNKRQGAARNAGIEIAQGEYIGFVDADDWIDETMFEKLYNCAVSKNYDVVGCHNYVVDSNEKVIAVSKTNSTEQVGILDSFKRKSLLVTGGNIWLKIYRRFLLTENHIRFPEGLSYEDNYFIPMVFLHCGSFGLVNEPLYYYYLSENSTVRTNNSATQFQRFETLDLLINDVEKIGLYEQYKDELEYLIIVLFYLNTAKLCVIRYRPYNYRMLFYIQKQIKKKLPLYYNNFHYKQQIPLYERKLLRINDFSPYLFAPLMDAAWHIYSFRRKRKTC